MQNNTGLQHYISQKYYIRKRSWKTKHREIGYEEKEKKKKPFAEMILKDVWIQ